MIAICLALILGITFLSSSALAQHNKLFVGYFPSWTVYRPGECSYGVEQVDASLYTHLIYAFSVLDRNTYEMVKFDSWGDEQAMPKLTALKQSHPGLKVLIAVGGWTFSKESRAFNEMAASQATRKVFIDSAIDFARQYGFDGIDMDWEYPTSADTENWTLLMKEFREALEAEDLSGNDIYGKKKERLLLTFASPAGASSYRPMNMGTVQQYSDWVNVMAYDYHGSWDSETGANAPLNDDGPLSVENTINDYLDLGVPAEKMALGMPAYGRSWTLSNSNNNGMGAPANRAGRAGSCTRAAGMLALYEIDEMIDNGAVVKFDEITSTPYLYSGDQWVTFDNKRSITAKIEFLKQQGLAGGMVWSLDTDTPLGSFDRLTSHMSSSLGIGQDNDNGNDESSSSSRGPVCGDNMCDVSESCNDCPRDCGECPIPSSSSSSSSSSSYTPNPPPTPSSSSEDEPYSSSSSSNEAPPSNEPSCSGKATGNYCYSPCSSTYYTCVNGNMIPDRPVAPGTVCLNGNLVIAATCSA